MLTDLPIGAWVMSALLDAAGDPAAEGAADLLVTAGVVAAVPTTAAGLHDWSDTAGPQTRVGLVHAAVNTTALSLYLASVIARARGRRRGGKALAPAGLGVLLGGGYLGGAQSAMAASPARGPVAPFRFADGSIVRSPASTPQPSYQTRIQNGRIEVRALT
jgi:hypothetical protein